MIHELSLDYKEHPLSWSGIGVPQGLLKMVCMPFVKGCQMARKQGEGKAKTLTEYEEEFDIILCKPSTQKMWHIMKDRCALLKE